MHQLGLPCVVCGADTDLEGGQVLPSLQVLGELLAAMAQSQPPRTDASPDAAVHDSEAVVRAVANAAAVLKQAAAVAEDFKTTVWLRLVLARQLLARVTDDMTRACPAEHTKGPCGFRPAYGHSSGWLGSRRAHRVP